MNQPTPSGKPSLVLAGSGPAARPLSRVVVLASVCWAMLFLLLWLEHRLGVVHPSAVLFVGLSLAAVVSSLVALVRCYRRVARGPRRGVALAWFAAALAPVGLAVWWVKYILDAVGRQDAPNTLPWRLAMVAVASLMEGQAAWAYPQRQETEHLVMFHDGVATPRADAEEMERHVARMEQLLDRPLRGKIYWVRGRLLGRGRMACGGVVLGSDASPRDWQTADHPDGLSVDRHELAHAVIHQCCPPDVDPPLLLVEGWADSQAGINPRAQAKWALESRDLWRERIGAGPGASYLEELAGPNWYHHIGGPMYNVGGPFAAHLLRRYGAEKFLRLYIVCRPGTFAAQCREVFGVEFAALEAEFWEETERLAHGDSEKPGPS
jgi:hypothetical protein